MLKNDESKRLMIRFKKSKDFYKTIQKLEKEGYKVYYSTDNGIIVDGKQTNEKIIMVGRVDKCSLGNCLISIFYEENEDTTSDYKQLIHHIIY